MSMPKWLEILKNVGPIAIAATVPGGAAIAPLVIAAIKSAEAIKGATGAEKKAHALEIVQAGAQVAANYTDKIAPAEVTVTASAAIDAAVGATNIIHRAKTPPPPATPAA